MANNAQAFTHPLVKKGTLRDGRVLDTISGGRPNAGPGMLSTPLPGGVVISAQPSRRQSAQAHPWKASPAGNNKIMVAGGAYNGVAVAARTGITGSGWVYLKATWSLEVEDDYVVAAELSAVQMLEGAAVPLDEDDVFYVPLVQYANGRVISQAATRSISASVCDAGTADGAGVHIILQS